MRNNLIHLGRTIKAKRAEAGLTLQQVADRAEITAGLVSKIENFRTVPSLPILLKLAAALDVSMADLVKDISTSEDSIPYLVIPKSARKAEEREESEGFAYESLITKETNSISSFQSYILTLAPNAKREKVVTDGDQFVFLLKGTIDFIIGDDAVRLEDGDSLYFDGSLPHLPVNTSDVDAVLLVIYLVKSG